MASEIPLVGYRASSADRRGPAGSSSTHGRPRVVVSAQFRLVADSLRAALISQGHLVRTVDWPVEQVQARIRLARREHWSVGVVLAELTSEDDLAQLGRLVREFPVPWLLLTNTPPGPAWGAALEQGVAAFSARSTTVEGLIGLIGITAAGRSALDGEQVGAHRAAWDELRAGPAFELRDRVRSLSPRETQVLQMLHAGRPVVEIATRLEMSQPTTRSHVRAVLRKLAVRSQLRAVGIYAEVQKNLFLTGGAGQ